jgi:prevent-host-death family protein
MTHYTASEARKLYAELINEAAYGGQRIVLTRHGKNIAAIVPISDLEMLHDLEQILNVTTLPALKRQFEQRQAGILDRSPTPENSDGVTSSSNLSSTVTPRVRA